MKIKTHEDHSASDAFWLIIAIFVVSMIVGIACYGVPTASASQPVKRHRIDPVYQVKYDAVRVNSDQLLKQKYITTGQLKMLVKEVNYLAKKYPTQESNLAVRHLSEGLSNKYVVNIDNGHFYIVLPKTIDYTHAGCLSKKITYKLIPTHEKADKNWLAKHKKDAE